MSFAGDFVSALRVDLAQALSLPLEAVYSGRRPQKVTRVGLEVWVHPQEEESFARGGGHQVRVHPFAVHVRLRARQEANQTGGAQVDLVAEHVEALRARYAGTRPFVQALPDLIAVEVDAGGVDEDPDEPDVLDGALTLRVLER